MPVCNDCRSINDAIVLFYFLARVMSYSFFKLIDNYRIILGSRSPRRAQLLKQLGLNFKVIVRPVNEEVSSQSTPGATAVYIAEQKWNSFADECSFRNAIVITADTLVFLENRFLGKPVNEEEALQMLLSLNGKMHEVFSGVKIGNQFYSESFYVKTDVWFRKLTMEEINFYIKEYKPFDKAGSYGAQDWIGLTAIEKIHGSFFNVMGLPVKEVYESLHRCLKQLNT